MAKSLGSGYILHEALGRGAMGEVFAGSVRATGEPVAIKILRPEFVSDPGIVARFVQERTILMSIADPHVVRVIDLVVEGDTLAIVMELVQGPDLRRQLRSWRTVPPAQALHLTGQLLSGMAAVHAAGIVHRDIKPENVLVDTSAGWPRLKLTDFGVARLSYGASLTKLTGVIGTPEYMAPELTESNRATPAADVYSAGIVLYEMLCGRTPFAGGHPLAVLRRQADQALPVIPDVPAELWHQLAWMLAKDPGSRPSSAAEAYAALAPLESSLASRPALAPWAGPEVWTPALTAPTHSQASTQDHSGSAPGDTVLRHRDRGAAAPGGLGGPASWPEAEQGLLAGTQMPLTSRSRRKRQVVAAGLAAAVAAVIGLVTTVALAATHHPPAAARPAAAGRTSAPGVTVSAGGPAALAQPTVSMSTAAGGSGSVSGQAPSAGSLSTATPGGGTRPTTPVTIQTAGGSSTGGPQPTVTTTATTTVTATATASLSAAEQQLAGSLNTRIFDDCTSAANELSVNTLAAINCSAITGPPSRPLIETLAPGHAETWFQNNTRGYTGSNCANGGYLGNWSHDGTVEGQLACGVTSSGLLRIVWTIDGNQVGLIAQGSDFQGLDTWWKSNACALPSAC